jgi:hypothetical protein
MKKNIISLIFLLFTFGLYAADVQRIDLNTNTATAQNETKTITDLQSAPGQGVFKGSVSKINFNLKTALQKDKQGVIFTNELGVSTRQTLFDNFLADISFRLIKPMANDLKGVEVQIMKGTFQYAGPYFQVLAGRTEATKIFSVMNFFGPYTTAGQKYIDILGATLPIFLTGGIPEIDEYKFPPLALSFYYAPTMFSLIHTDWSGDQALYIGQLRLNTILFDMPTQVVVNIGKSTTEYFKYSIMSGEISAEASAVVDLAKHYKISFAGAVLNVNEATKTSVISAGLELYNFREWLIAIDKVVFEQQLPLNPETMISTWFVSAENKIARFRYGVVLSNTINNFTLLGVNLVNSAPAYGGGNIYGNENVTFLNTDNNEICYYAYIGYDF